jgi:hypothetical protein
MFSSSRKICSHTSCVSVSPRASAVAISIVYDALSLIALSREGLIAAWSSGCLIINLQPSTSGDERPPSSPTDEIYDSDSVSLHWFGIARLPSMRLFNYLFAMYFIATIISKMWLIPHKNYCCM